MNAVEGTIFFVRPNKCNYEANDKKQQKCNSSRCKHVANIRVGKMSTSKVVSQPVNCEL